MKIILVEDDHLQADFMTEYLEKVFGDRVEVIPTELAFRERLTEIDRTPPEIFIIDVILRWTDPQPGTTLPPKEVGDEGRERAGFRCQKLLAERDATRNLPIVLYSFLDGSHFEPLLRDLPPWVEYLQKDSDITPLCDVIRRLTGDTPA